MNITVGYFVSGDRPAVRILCCVDLAAGEPQIAMTGIGAPTDELQNVIQSKEVNEHQFCYSGFLESSADLFGRVVECTVTDSMGCYIVKEVVSLKADGNIQGTGPSRLCQKFYIYINIHMPVLI